VGLAVATGYAVWAGEYTALDLVRLTQQLRQSDSRRPGFGSIPSGSWVAGWRATPPPSRRSRGNDSV